MALTCTPNGLLDVAPCIKCLSRTELEAALVLVLCHIANQSSRADCTPETLGADAACFKCVSDTMLLQMLVNALYQYAIDSGWIEVGDLKQEAICLLCAQPHALRAMIVQLVCTWLSNIELPQ